MEKNSTILKVIFIPELFHVENKSARDLLKDSEYYEIYNEISEEDIGNLLQKFPEVIHTWRQWSDDKRVSSGWYFINNIEGKYAVGYYPQSADIKERIFSDAIEACAYYIKAEIEHLRDSGLSEI